MTTLLSLEARVAQLEQRRDDSLAITQLLAESAAFTDLLHAAKTGGSRSISVQSLHDLLTSELLTRGGESTPVTATNFADAVETLIRQIVAEEIVLSRTGYNEVSNPNNWIATTGVVVSGTNLNDSRLQFAGRNYNSQVLDLATGSPQFFKVLERSDYTAGGFNTILNTSGSPVILSAFTGFPINTSISGSETQTASIRLTLDGVEYLYEDVLINPPLSGGARSSVAVHMGYLMNAETALNAGGNFGRSFRGGGSDIGTGSDLFGTVADGELAPSSVNALLGNVPVLRAEESMRVEIMQDTASFDVNGRDFAAVSYRVLS